MTCFFLSFFPSLLFSAKTDEVLKAKQRKDEEAKKIKEEGESFPNLTLSENQKEIKAFFGSLAFCFHVTPQ